MKKILTWMNKVFMDSIFYVGVCGIIGWLVYADMEEKKADAALLEQKKTTVCPALLSIGRSARDTLIVMKAESVCNEYVLERLK
jgi:hypothetical protein